MNSTKGSWRTTDTVPRGRFPPLCRANILMTLSIDLKGDRRLPAPFQRYIATGSPPGLDTLQLANLLSVTHGGKNQPDRKSENGVDKASADRAFNEHAHAAARQ
ncbi:hypothetical protein G6F57_023647 [Rhizopus arrhizus]|nr:hypothetical protein G6F57_023647 [Rhizopus arrhizus]